ncbi:hypothetical protein T492DRAFT_955886 [Pavlovales sp. CCMP2436]|nr:hypothetical protein T492DRAFT_955886 [Pavlovales sp. CCMP2436]|mmetsp:Transcript_5881/g.15391  ORF Transcript_5881/g.15391 Transcript_5881/m.15391 type:complete len:283 (-) Transcript_5881:195-1043(-)
MLAAPEDTPVALASVAVDMPASRIEPVADISPTQENECRICLEEESDDNDSMLVDICACKMTGIHHSCLEKLVNSRARRVKPLAERIACPVCALTFNVSTQSSRIAFTVMAPTRTGEFQPFTKRTLSSGIATAFGVALAVRLFSDVMGRQVAFLISTVLIFALMSVVIFNRRRRPTNTAGDATSRREGQLDDVQFFSQVVSAHRQDMDAHFLSPEAVSSTPNQRVVVHVLKAAPPVAVAVAVTQASAGAVPGGLVRSDPGRLTSSSAPTPPTSEPPVSVANA